MNTQPMLKITANIANRATYKVGAENNASMLLVLHQTHTIPNFILVIKIVANLCTLLHLDHLSKEPMVAMPTCRLTCIGDDLHTTWNTRVVFNFIVNHQLFQDGPLCSSYLLVSRRSPQVLSVSKTSDTEPWVASQKCTCLVE